MAKEEIFNRSASTARNRETERIFMQVSSYDLAKTTGWISGINLVTGEDIQVRLNTIDERLSDRPSANRKNVESTYSTGSFKREGFAQKFQKRASVLMLDDCVAIDEKGIKGFRSHWPTTVATENQNVKVIHSDAVHLKLRKNLDGTGRDVAYVEIINPSVKLTAENYEEVLLKAFADRDEDDNPHRPIALLDLQMKGKPVFDVIPRLYPSTNTDSVYDDSIGGMKDIRVTADAKQSVSDLIDGTRIPSDGREALNIDYFRAAIAAVRKEPLPELTTESETIKLYAQQIYDLVKKEELTVNIGSATVYNFGPQSAKTYLANSDKKHLSGYSVNRKSGETVRPVSGYTEALVSLGQYEDGTYYARDVISAEPYPKASSLNEISLTTLKSPEVKYHNNPLQIHDLEDEKIHLPNQDNDNSAPSL